MGEFSAPGTRHSNKEAPVPAFRTKPVERGELLARIRAGSRVLELERHLSRMASIEPLTGLLTQRSFYEALEKEWRRSRRSHLPLSCVMMDVDFFKRVNDIHGHPTGDLILKAVAELLSANCRSADTLCRYGGEEFCIMLPETSEQEAAVWAERVRMHLAALVVRSGDKQIRVTGSFGAAQCHDDTQTSTAGGGPSAR